MDIYKLRFFERAWLLRYELAFGKFKLPCLFLLDCPVITDDMLMSINFDLRENLYNWTEFEEIKSLLVEKVHPEYNGLDLLELDLDNSVIVDVTTINIFQWWYLKKVLPYLNYYQAPSEIK
jgi:hypothetical protein